ncbi:MAG: PAS domain S-box protein [Chitinophagaceae bacterium]|nr:PAS domain S-box protein [Chitinophagaceae bacterium]
MGAPATKRLSSFRPGYDVNADIPLSMRIRQWSGYFSIFVLIISILALLGWELDIEIMKNPIKGAVVINPLTAVSFSLFGLSFILMMSKRRSRAYSTIAALIACTMILIAVFRLGGIVQENGWQIDQILYADKLKEAELTGSVPMMTASIAVCLFLAGVSLLIFCSDRKRLYKFAQVLTIVIFFTGLFALTGYLYRVPEIYQLNPFLSMAIHSSVSFIFIALALLCSNPETGIMKEFTNGYSGSLLAQKLVPAAIALPVFLGLVRLYGHWRNWFSTEFGASILVLSIILIILSLAWYITILLNKRDKIRQMIEKKFELLLQSAPDAMIISNDKGVIELINNQTERLFGYTKEEMIGLNIEALVPQGVRKQHVHHREAYHADPKVRSMGVGLELFAVRKDGVQFPVEISLSPIITEMGTVVSSSIRDITDRKNLQDQLRKSNEEMSAFTYSVSHDLRAPLRSVIGFSTILEEDYGSKLDEEALRITATIRNSAVRMGHLIDDLLAFSRMGRQQMLKTRVVSDGMVKDCIAEICQQQACGNIIWEVSKLPDVMADHNTLKQVWLNLIGNAVKYSSGQPIPRINIGTYTELNSIVFFVKDNGVGFDPAYTHKLFKVFQRLHAADEFEGTGVGLALVEKIIIRHEGRVWAESRVNEGACFYFSLPDS